MLHDCIVHMFEPISIRLVRYRKSDLRAVQCIKIRKIFFGCKILKMHRIFPQRKAGNAANFICIFFGGRYILKKKV